MHIRTSHNGSLTVTPSEERQQVIDYLTQHDAVVEIDYEFDSERFITLNDIVIADELLDSVLSGYRSEHEVTIDMSVDYADELNTGHRRATITVQDGTTSVEVIEAEDECASVGAYYRFGYEGLAEDFVDFTAEGIQQAIDAELVDVEEGFNSEAFADFIGDTELYSGLLWFDSADELDEGSELHTYRTLFYNYLESFKEQEKTQ